MTFEVDLTNIISVVVMATIGIISVWCQRKLVLLTRRELEANKVSIIARFLLAPLKAEIEEILYYCTGQGNHLTIKLNKNLKIRDFAYHVCARIFQDDLKLNPNLLVDDLQHLLEIVKVDETFIKLSEYCESLSNLISQHDELLDRMEGEIKRYISKEQYFDDHYQKYRQQSTTKPQSLTFTNIEDFKRNLVEEFWTNYNYKVLKQGLVGAWHEIQQMTSREEAYMLLDDIVEKSGVRKFMVEYFKLRKKICEKAESIKEILQTIIWKIKKEYPTLTPRDFTPHPSLTSRRII